MHEKIAHDNISTVANLAQSCTCAQTLRRRVLDKAHALAVFTVLCYTDERSRVAVWNSHAPQVISCVGIVEGTHDESDAVFIAKEGPHVFVPTTLAIFLG